jgi:broad specificity phosphatase PhoE
MKKHLYLIRHGVTNHLANNIQQTDTSELSEHGHAQAAAVARRFGARPHDGTSPRGAYDFAYNGSPDASSGAPTADSTQQPKDYYIDTLATSPYTRAAQTAEAIAHATGLPAEVLAYAHERRVPSSLEGKSIHGAEREAVIEKIFKLWLAGKNERLEDEETYLDIVARVNKLKQYVSRHTAEHIAVVSHATFIKTFLSTVFHADVQASRAMLSLYHSHEVSNTGVSEFTYDPARPEGQEWKLVTWNDRAHLFHLATTEKPVAQD